MHVTMFECIQRLRLSPLFGHRGGTGGLDTLFGYLFIYILIIHAKFIAYIGLYWNIMEEFNTKSMVANLKLL